MQEAQKTATGRNCPAEANAEPVESPANQTLPGFWRTSVEGKGGRQYDRNSAYGKVSLIENPIVVDQGT
jgi:hypothetical protein